MATPSDLDLRATRHAALGDPNRLAVVDALGSGDLTPTELGVRLHIAGNLLAHHLRVLEGAGLVARRHSEGDGRRRYVVLSHDALAGLAPAVAPPTGRTLFVCTHNSARSQFARALWSHRTGRPAESAGTAPAVRVHPLAVRVAAEHGLDISAEQPRGYQAIAGRSDLVISVCDLAAEAALPPAGRHLHWAIPDPVRVGGVTAFRRAFGEIAARIDAITPARGNRPGGDRPMVTRGNGTRGRARHGRPSTGRDDST